MSGKKSIKAAIEKVFDDAGYEPWQSDTVDRLVSAVLMAEKSTNDTQRAEAIIAAFWVAAGEYGN